MKKYRVWMNAKYTDEAMKRMHRSEDDNFASFPVYVEQEGYRNDYFLKAEAIKKVLQEVKIDEELNVFRVYKDGSIKVVEIVDTEEETEELNALFGGYFK